MAAQLAPGLPGADGFLLTPNAGRMLAITLTADARRMLAGRYGVPPEREPEALKSLLGLLGADEVFLGDCCWDDHAHAEAEELLLRMRKGLPLPQIIHACPKWAADAKAERPGLLPYFSAVPLHAQRRGLAARARISARHGVPPESVVHITVVGCPARKAALLQNGLKHGSSIGPEYVLTAREVALWLARRGLDGAAGKVGAASAAPAGRGSRLRDVAAHALLIREGRMPEPGFLRLYPVNGLPGVEEGTVWLGDVLLRVAVVRGLCNACALPDGFSAGRAGYHLAEVLACAGGCAGV